MNRDELRKKIYKLIKSTNRNSKYLRNLMLYTETPLSSLDNVEEIVGFYNVATERTSLVQQNIIQATISALVAKLAEHARARPFINTIHGNFEDRQKAKCLQKYYDVTFDRDNVYEVVSNVFRDACIFDTGYVFINRDLQRVEKIWPWQVYFDNYEVKYNNPKQVVLLKKKYPTILLDDFKETDRYEYVTLIEYWNTKLHKKITTTKECTSYWKEEIYEPDVLPFIKITYETSVNGALTSTSVVDLLYGIQKTVNELCEKMGKCIRANPGSMTLVPTNSTIKVDKVDNEPGRVVPYEPVLGANAPIQQITPDLFDSSLMNTLQRLKEDAYELVGISQLSVTGQRDDESNMSGVAIKSMENIEADRFQTQLNKIIRLYVDIARREVEIFRENEKVLPEDNSSKNYTWKQIKNSISKFKLQFSSAANISKDPSEKYKIIKGWAAEGLIPANRITSLLDIPDLEEASSFAANSYNAVQTIIYDCLEKDEYDIPDYIPIEELKPEIANTMLMLKALGPENEDDIAKLTKLFEKCLDKEAKVGRAAQTDEANEALDTEANMMDEQSTFLELQAQQMTGVINDLQNGAISVDQANAQLSSMNDIGSFDFAGV